MSLDVKPQSNVVNFGQAKAAKFGSVTVPPALRFSGVDSVRLSNTVKFGQGEAKAEETSGKAPYSFGLQNFFNPFKNFWGSALYGAIAGAVTLPIAAGAGALIAPLFWILSAFGVGRGGAADTPLETKPETAPVDTTKPAPDAKVVDNVDKKEEKKTEEAKKVEEALANVKASESLEELAKRTRTLRKDLKKLGLEESNIAQVIAQLNDEQVAFLGNNKGLQKLMKFLSPSDIDTSSTEEAKAIDPKEAIKEVASVIQGTREGKAAGKEADKGLALIAAVLADPKNLIKILSLPVDRLETALKLVKDQNLEDVTEQLTELVEATHGDYDDKAELNDAVKGAIEPAVKAYNAFTEAIKADAKARKEAKKADKKAPEAPDSSAIAFLSGIREQLLVQINGAVANANKMAAAQAQEQVDTSKKHKSVDYMVYKVEKAKEEKANSPLEFKAKEKGKAIYTPPASPAPQS